MGLLTQQDSTLYRGWFKEMCNLRGLPIRYRSAKIKGATIHSEPVTEFSDPININVIYDANPKTSTLKKLGWVSELPEDKPYIVFLPYDIPDLTVEARILIPQINAIGKSEREFRVTAINSLIEYPDCWICKIAPVFTTVKSETQYDKKNYSYIQDNEWSR